MLENQRYSIVYQMQAQSANFPFCTIEPNIGVVYLILVLIN
jgi:ribosome-binding ATPase YchF (GTP1/OBG family)